MPLMYNSKFSKAEGLIDIFSSNNGLKLSNLSHFTAKAIE